MKERYLLLAVVFTFSASAQTNVSGFINANTTWDLAGSPYIIVGNTLLSSGYTLTIDPGVVVKFNDNTVLQIDGELHAIGIFQNRITFTNNQTDWSEIHFTDPSPNAVVDGNGNYISGSIMKYCDISYGGTGTGMIHIDNTSPYFNHCNITYSSSDGLYCFGASCVVDSSNVRNCNGSGLHFKNIQTTSCGLKIVADSITDHTNGGVYVEGVPGCSTLVKGNYFANNINRGAFYGSEPGNSPWTSCLITENIFINNTSASGYYGVVLLQNGAGTLVNHNTFLNNAANSATGAIINFGHTSGAGGGYTVECNLFLNNQAGGYGLIGFPYTGDGVINSNHFEGNHTTYSVVLTYHHGMTVTGTGIHFTNNTAKNNSCPTGTLCWFEPDLYTTVPHMHIHHNNFADNTAQSIVHFTGSSIGNTTNNFLEMHHNNFQDAGTPYELYNDIPSGSPAVHADTNYWGNSNLQHIDSVIYDFFNDGSKSVVYYTPILVDPAVIDTSCYPPIPTIISNIVSENFIFKLFPNPFTSSATITMGKEIHNGTLSFYSLLGEKVKTISGISGESLHIDRGNLQSGVYVYEMMEGGTRIGRGKVVVY